MTHIDLITIMKVEEEWLIYKERITATASRRTRPSLRGLNQIQQRFDSMNKIGSGPGPIVAAKVIDLWSSSSAVLREIGLDVDHECLRTDELASR